MRQVARVQTVTGAPVLIPKRTANLAAGWVAETAQHALSEPTYTQRVIAIFEARVTVEVTNQLLEDTAFNLACRARRRLRRGVRPARGRSVRQRQRHDPAGRLPDRGRLRHDAGGAALDADDIIDLYHAVPSRYAANGTWLMRRETIGEVRKVRTAAHGRVLWADSLQPGQPAVAAGPAGGRDARTW